MNRKIIFFLFLILNLSFITPAPAQTNVNLDVGLSIDYPKFETLEVSQPFNLSVKTFNVSSGKYLNGSNCTMELHNQTGGLVFSKANLTSTQNSYNVYISEGNFTQLDTYAFLLYCEHGDLGGFASGTFDVTYLGEYLPTSSAVLYSTFFFILILSFILILFSIAKLPNGNISSDDGKVLRVGYLKYLRHSLWLVEWGLLIAISFMVSNVSYAYFGNALFGDFFLMIFRLMVGFSLPLCLLWVLWLFSQIVEDKQIWNLINHGFTLDDKNQKKF